MLIRRLTMSLGSNTKSIPIAGITPVFGKKIENVHRGNTTHSPVTTDKNKYFINKNT